MNSITRILTPSSVPRWVATATVALSLLVPLSASADHERNQTFDILAGAAVAYALFEIAGGYDDDQRHHRYKRHHRRHDSHGYRNKHRRHDNHGYRNKHHNKHRRHGDRYSAYRH